MDLMVPQIGDFVQFRIAFPVGRSTMKFVWPKFSVWTIPSSFVREEVCGEVVYDWHSPWSTSQTKLYPAGVCIHLKLPGDVQTMYEFCEISLLNVLPPRGGSLTAAGWRMADGTRRWKYSYISVNCGRNSWTTWTEVKRDRTESFAWNASSL